MADLLLSPRLWKFPYRLTKFVPVKQCTAIPNVLGFFLFKKCVFMISCSCEMKQLESCCH